MGGTILVVGGAGYIGSHCLQELRERGFDTLCYDNLSEGHRAAVGDTELLVGDLGDRDRLDEVLGSRDIDAVFHFAAHCYVGESCENPEKYYRNNVACTLELLSAMVQHGIKRFIFSSTAATFGNPVSEKIDESHPQQPINPYGQTKLVVEHMLRDFHAAYGLESIALRYFNAAGASESGNIGEDHDPETHLIPLVLKTALGQRDSISIFGDDYPTPDGTCVRDYIHIVDLADAHIRGLEYLQAHGGCEAFNLGNGSGYSVKEVIDAAARVTEREIPAIVTDRRPGDPPMLVADARRAREVLGWRQRFGDIDTILRTAWKWHREHPDGYDD